ncbi:hypothetical protein CAEBREN_11203 [Caenorhabditis brenneri]|uniref:Sdz-33 F-box domain-containing protein n=1 Tax=Caenorhabditis brenneri TaxID=135651 RepID=G0NPI7_CAEBE|nr:hypothetical protein CAEBREN_11203 [Caenorhabditis brenneri]
MPPEFPLGLAAAISDKHQIRIIGECYYPYMHIDSITKIDSYDGIRRNMKIGEDIVPFVFYHEDGYIDELTAFFDDKTEGFLSILEYFKNHLNISVSSLDIHGDNGPEFSKTMRDVIHSCSQMAVSKTVEESEQPLSEQDFNFILKSFETFYSETEEKLEFHLEIDSDSITVRNGSWFQLDHLLVGCQKYEEIHVTESKLTESDMKTFLTQWKDGKFPKLKNVSVKTVMTDSFDAVRDFEQYPTESTARSRIPCVSIKGYENTYAMITQRAGPKMFNMEVRRQNGRARGFRTTGYRLGNNRGEL